ncbi:MAG: two-component sensor histidine kinase [Paenibacillaceae bacterium ZCTH02-B3]|nr:MAG: two-component sensor histidine kinase [Paenibacillaceae bacterium ZCTH02-B3]
MSGIQRKILSLSAIMLFIMAAIWTFLTYYNQQMLDRYNRILQRYLQLYEMSSASQQLVVALNTYLQTPDGANLANLSAGRQRVLDAKRLLEERMASETAVDPTDYLNLVDSLVEAADRSYIMSARELNSVQAMIDFAESDRYAKYIAEMTQQLMEQELRTYDSFYRGIIRQSAELKKLGFWLLAFVTMVLLLFSYGFSHSITRPVRKLTLAARELARGRFDMHIEVQSNDEIAFLARTFDHMRVNMGRLISEIQMKAQLESELQTSRLLLKESQLRSLQSQINPHFLFNTLDTLSKKAYLEGSPETSDLLANVAGLLRYNLRRLDRPVTLWDEVRVLRQYIEIQKARFGDRLRFVQDIDETCLNLRLPGLTLQPIVENAVIHAVEPSEKGGTVTFRVRDLGDRVAVDIEDDGVGMSEGKIREIMEERLAEGQGHSTGIGISNVIRRLRLFYGVDDVIRIDSAPGAGTKVRLRLPKAEGGIAHVQAADRGR